MDCKTNQQLQAAWDDGSLDRDTARLVAAHLDRCAGCRAAFKADKRLADWLGQMPAPDMPEGFAGRAFQGIDNSLRQQRRRQITGLALAASLIIGIGVGIVASRMIVPKSVVAQGNIVVAADTVTTVRLAFDARHELRNVRFILRLPKGIEVKGHPGQREIAWWGELKTGRNMLRIPVVVRAGTQGILEAALRHNGRQKTFRVRIAAHA